MGLMFRVEGQLNVKISCDHENSNHGDDSMFLKKCHMSRWIGLRKEKLKKTRIMNYHNHILK